MKLTIKSLGIITVVMLTACIWGCGKINRPAFDMSDDPISEFKIVQTVKSAERTYLCEGAEAYFDDSLRVYSKTSIDVQWPEQMGDYDIHVLQDSLLECIFEHPEQGIDKSILRALDMPEGRDLYKMKPVDSISGLAGCMVLYRDIVASVITFSRQFIVYQVMSSVYDGGAHGITMSRYLNYDFRHAAVITSANAFRPGSEGPLLQIIKSQLMSDYGVESVQALESKGIFVNQLYVSKNIYLQGYSIVFHYNPYEIAPFAAGGIDVAVPYYLLADYLMPEVFALVSNDELD